MILNLSCKRVPSETEVHLFLLFFLNVIVICVRMCGKEGKMCTLSLNINGHCAYKTLATWGSDVMCKYSPNL